MIKVKTFASEIKIFHTVRELQQLDAEVNKFIADSGIKKVISVCDACPTDDSGSTIGLIRTIAYEDGK
jgi:hypothetical protein